jgi:hypothetical protein
MALQWRRILAWAPKAQKENLRNEHDPQSWMITAWRVWGSLLFRCFPVWSFGLALHGLVLPGLSRSYHIPFALVCFSCMSWAC